MNHLTIETDDSFSSLLDLAANDDFDKFKHLMERDCSAINSVGLWYGRQKYSKQMILEPRTPLMVAATYGSLSILKLIISKSEVDVNFSCGPNKATALHCAASGGSLQAVDTVKLLLLVGANPKLVDSNGHRPIDVIIVPPKLPCIRVSLEELLATNEFETISHLSLTASDSLSSSLPSLSSENGSPSSSPSDQASSPMAIIHHDLHISSPEKKEYPIDPSLPDIKNSMYLTDEFRMYSFKVRPCSRAYSHDWTECPFVHPGENARRRDPRKHHYSCVPCPEFRKGTCRRGDLCEYAHGVFECWLHPAQYRTRLCKDGTECSRRVCFFAHTANELRPLYMSTGSGVPSPKSSADLLSLSSGFPLSPSSPLPNVPPLHLPQNNYNSGRLRSSLSARNARIQPSEGLNPFHNDFNRTSHISLSPFLRSKTLNPNYLDALEKMTISPRYSDERMLGSMNAPIFSPENQNRCLFNNVRVSPRNMEVMSPRCVNSWGNWGGGLDWTMNEDGNGNVGEEPDLSWVQSLMESNDSNNTNPELESVLGEQIRMS